MRPNQSADRCVLVSGGTRGIGRSCVASLADAGYRVASLSRTGSPVDDCLSLTCDITDPAAVTSALSTVRAVHGPIDALVLNAGGPLWSPALLTSDEAFRTALDLNLVAQFRLARLAARDMWRKKWGRIVFVSSLAASLGCAGSVGYAAAKGGLEAVVKTLALEWSGAGITVNAVAPGGIATDLTREHPDWVHTAGASIPVGRIGEPGEVAAAVMFLLEEGASYISGATLPVDGGLRLSALAESKGNHHSQAQIDGR